MHHARTLRTLGLALPLLAAAACGSVVSEQTDASDDAGDGDGDGGWDGDTGREDAVPDDDGVTEVPATCGNGVVEPPEECDDRNTVAGDGCENDCTWTCEEHEDCADGLPCNGEEQCNTETHACEPGLAPADGTECTTLSGGPGVCRSGSCAPASCGNGSVEGDEECDDGNTDDTDACLTDCRNAFCGDGFIRSGVEECDTEGAPCTTTCESTGNRACLDGCELSDVCSPPAEVCNGLDDDCIDGCDNGFACCAGTTVFGSEADTRCPWSAPCGSACTIGTWDFGPPPGNDACAGATEIRLTDGHASYTGSTCAATDDYTPAFECVGVSAAPDVVFQLVLAGPKLVRLSTSGSAFDTVLSISRGTGSSCPGTPVACNDDSPDADDAGGSELELNLLAGTYYVTLDGAAGARGDYVLEVVAVDVPVNDECSNARALTPDAAVRFEDGTTLGATDDLARCGTGGSVGAGPDVWFRIPLGTGAHFVYLDLLDGRSWAGVLRIYDACPAAAGTLPRSCEAAGACGAPRPKWLGPVGTNDTTSRTLYVAVDGVAATDQGLFRLRYQVAPSTCASALEIRAVGAVDGLLDPSAALTQGTCGGLGPEQMYVFAPCPGTAVSASTCFAETRFNSVLYLRTGGCGVGVGSAVQLACNTLPGDCGFTNGTSIAIGGAAVQAGLHFLFVDSDSAVAADGNFRLYVEP